MINVFNSNYEEIGSLDKNLALHTLGKIKIRYGRKYIDLLNDKGELNVSIPLVLKKVNSEKEMKSNGFYMLDGNLYLYYDNNIIQLTGNEEGDYVKYNEDLELTQELQDKAKRNIGITFNTILDAMNYVTKGIVNVGDKLYYILNGSYRELFTLNEPVKSINEINYNPDEDGSAIIYIDGEWIYRKVPSENDLEQLQNNFDDLFKILADKINISKKDKLFDPLQYSTVYNIDNFSITKNNEGNFTNEVYIETIPTLALKENDIAVATCIAAEAEYLEGTDEEDNTPYKILTYKLYEEQGNTYIKEKAIPIELQYKGNNKFEIIKPSFNNNLTLKSGEPVLYIKEGDEYWMFPDGIKKTVSLYHLFVKVEKDQINKFKIDYNNAEIALEENKIENGLQKLTPHTVLGDIDDTRKYYSTEQSFRTYTDESSPYYRPQQNRGLYSDLAVFNGAEFRGEFPNEELNNDKQYNYAKYSELLSKTFTNIINDVNYTNTFDNVIPPYKAVKLNQPLRSINLQGTNKEGLGLPDNNNFINPNNIWKDKTNSVIVFKGITNGLALWEYRKYLLTPLTEINEDLGNNNPTKDKQIIRWNNTLKKWEYVDHTVLNSPLSEINSSNLTKLTSEGYILMSKGGSTGLWKYFNLQEWITLMELCCTDVTNRLEALEDAVEEANKTFNVIWKYIDKSYTESVKNNEYAKWGGSTSGINTVIAYVSTKDYEFDGEWNGFDYLNIAVTEELILTAKLYKLYTVTWKSDETLLKTQKVRENTTVTYTEETPIKIGYTFNGWNPNPENTPITLNTTFIAKWIAKAVYIETNHPEISGKGDVEDPTTITYWAQVDNNIIADENVKLVVVSNDGLQFSEDLENSPKIVNGKWVKTITVAKNNEERLKSYTVKVIYDNIEKELTIKQQGKDWTPSFDYMVFKYDWDSDNSGADIDSATIINCNKIPITETTKLSDYYVGFPSTDNGKSRVILNGNKLNAVTKYLEWGGDTTKPGAEGACINFKLLCKDYAKTLVNQGIEEITVDIYARKYYSNISIKRLTISYDLYKGENGLNIDSNNTFIPNAGTTIVQNDLENSYTTQDIAGNISQGYINVKLLDTKIMSVIYNINTTSAKIVKHNPFETGATLLELLITGNITIYLDGEEIIRSIINTTKSDTGYSFDNYNPSPGTIYTLNKNISYNSEHNIIIEITNLTYTETITYYNGKTLYGDISHVFNINDLDVNRVYYYSESTGVSNESCPFNVNLEGNTLGNLKCTINTNVFSSGYEIYIPIKFISNINTYCNVPIRINIT